MGSPFASAASLRYVGCSLEALREGADTFVTRLAVAHQPSSTLPTPAYFIAAALSNHSIHLYSLVPSRSHPPALSFLTAIRAHTSPITDLQFFNTHSSCLPASPPPDSHVLLSCSEDGVVLAHDSLSLSASPLLRLHAPTSDGLFSCAGSGHLILCGSSSSLFLFSTRPSPHLVTSFPDFHTADVTAVAFHPLHPHLMLSASLDGTVCVFKQQVDASDPEDEQLVCSLAVEADVAAFGFFGPQCQYLWTTTTTEQVALHELDTARRRSEYGQLDVRPALERAAGCRVEYMVGCAYREEDGGRLYLLCGNNNGSLVLVHLGKRDMLPVWRHSSCSTVDYHAVHDRDVQVSITCSSDDDDAQPAAADGQRERKEGHSERRREEKDGQQAAPRMELETEEEESGDSVDLSAAGHVATVRCMLWVGSVMLTAGNDGKICIWSQSAAD